MDANLRIVTHLPLRELWRDDGFSTTTRGKSLTDEDVRQVLKSGPVQFVIVVVGAAPRWIPASECFQFWKNEAKPHLATGARTSLDEFPDGYNEAKPHLATGARTSLDEFPDGYCYFASRWEGRQPEAPIVVLEKQH